MGEVSGVWRKSDETGSIIQPVDYMYTDWSYSRAVDAFINIGLICSEGLNCWSLL